MVKFLILMYLIYIVWFGYEIINAPTIENHEIFK